MNNRLKKGFSLVEMLVVVAIIGILSTVLYVGYSKYVDKSAKNAIEKEASDVMNVFEVAFVDHQAVGRASNAEVNETNFYGFDELYNISLKNTYNSLVDQGLPRNVYLRFDKEKTHVLYDHNGYTAYYNISAKKIDKVEKQQ